MRESYDKLLENQELYWAQRAKEKWMVWGERNTSYFHKVASIRARRNRIVCLKNVDGDLVTGQDEIQQLVVSHFLDLFQGSFSRNGQEVSFGPGLVNSVDLQGVQLLSNMGVRLSESQICDLELPF